MISRETLKIATHTIDDTQLEILHRIILAFSSLLDLPECLKVMLDKMSDPQRANPYGTGILPIYD
ncbi:MAG: hypothetical protein WCO45_09710 [Pseudanabaena sp. ELA607]